MLMKQRAFALAVRALLGIAVAVLVSSCIDIKTEIVINQNGGGTVTLEYAVSKMVLNMGTIDDDQRFYAVPISEDDFRKTANGIEGLTLDSFKMKEEVEVIHINAELKFESIESLSKLFSTSGPGEVTLSQSDGKTSYTHTLFQGATEKVDEDSRKMIQTFFGDYGIDFSLRAPDDIASVSAGTFDGREARFELPLPEAVLSEAPLVWQVVW